PLAKSSDTRALPIPGATACCASTRRTPQRATARGRPRRPASVIAASSSARRSEAMDRRAAVGDGTGGRRDAMKITVENKARFAFATLVLLGAAIGLAWTCWTSSHYAAYEIRTRD